MTTEALPTFSQYLAMKLASKAKNRARRVELASTRVPAFIQAIARLVLHLVGFGCLTLAGFTLSMAAGLVIAGISCFVLSWLNTSNPQTTEVGRAPDMRTGR